MEQKYDDHYGQPYDQQHSQYYQGPDSYIPNPQPPYGYMSYPQGNHYQVLPPSPYGTVPPTIQVPPQIPAAAYPYQYPAAVQPLPINFEQMLTHSLQQYGLFNHRARVAILLDISSTMQSENEFYSSHKIDSIVQKIVTMASVFDDNKVVEIFPFGTKCNKIYPVSPQTDVRGVIDNIINDNRGYDYFTDFAGAISTVRRHYFGNNGALSHPQPAELPVFAVVVTDGKCNFFEQLDAKGEVVNASHQPLFLKFIGIRGRTNCDFSFLHSLDNAAVKGDRSWALFTSKRHIDNVDLQVIDNPEELTYDHLLHEYPSYLNEAARNGLLTRDPGVVFTPNAADGRVVGAHTSRLTYGQQNLCRIM